MRKTKSSVLLLTGLTLVLFLTGCKKDDDNDVAKFSVTQALLDNVTTKAGEETGSGFAHGGPDGISADSTIREIFSSLANLDGDIPTGTIITKKTYKKGADGKKTDQLFVTFAMVKREVGYSSTGGDWEYIKIPFDASVDYTAHPNGMLPDESNTDLRGELMGCIGCHTGANGNDFLYVND